MTEPLRALTTPRELHDAIAEATEACPNDPDEAVRYILDNFAMTPEIALSLRLQGERELGRLN